MVITAPGNDGGGRKSGGGGGGGGAGGDIREWPPLLWCSAVSVRAIITLFIHHTDHTQIYYLPPSPLPSPHTRSDIPPPSAHFAKVKKSLQILTTDRKKCVCVEYFWWNQYKMCKIHYNALRALVIFNLYFAQDRQHSPSQRSRAHGSDVLLVEINQWKVKCYYGGLQHYCTTL